MSFISPSFFVFLVVVLAGCVLVGGRPRIIFLTFASYGFYATSSAYFLLILLASTVVDYTLARVMNQCVDRPTKAALLTISVVMNIGLLAIFKYTAFLAECANLLLSAVGLDFRLEPIALTLPIGISFYTFMALSYTIDTYRGVCPPTRSPLDFSFLIAFFPHLVAGPILRAKDFLPQIDHAQFFKRENVILGVEWVLLGLFKKAVVADHCATLADPVFASPGAYGGAAHWLAAVFFAIQIYADFSGYTDTARGLAKILGFDFCVNFHAPLLSPSIRDFWRRWHMSLSSWLRDYLYIPLGGNRHGWTRTAIATMATWLLGGLWHGAAWHFVAWGAYHGALVVTAGRLGASPLGKIWERIPHMVQVLTTFGAVVAGWVLFRATSMSDAKWMWHHMAQPWRPDFWDGAQMFSGLPLAMLVILAALHCGFYAWMGTGANYRSALMRMPYPARAITVALTGIATVVLAGEPKSFIYFAF